jgi:hypothetical protein
MNERVLQFHQDADELVKASKTATASSTLAQLTKQSKALRTFLFKQQAARFTDGERGKLFDAIILLRKVAEAGAGVQHTLPLVSDALKMPASMFTNKMKERLLALFEKDAGAVNAADAAAATSAPGAAANGATERLTAVDVDADDGTCSVLLDDGEVKQFNVAPELAERLQASIDAGDEVLVDVDVAKELVLSIAS